MVGFFSFQNATVSHFCSAYQCNQDKGWDIGFDACICPDEDHLKALDSKWPSSIPRCCPESLLTLHREQNLTCPLSNNDKGQFCPNSKFVMETGFNFTNDQDILIRKYDHKIQNYTWKTMAKGHQFCIAPIWHITGMESEIEKPMQVKLFACIEPCDGKKPCIR